MKNRNKAAAKFDKAAKAAADKMRALIAEARQNAP